MTEAWALEEAAPSPPPPRRRAHAGHLLLNAFVGDLVGAAVGALVATGIAGLFECTNGESDWLPGFNCASGFAFAAAIGGLYGATLGGPLGVLRIGGRTEAGGDAGVALLAGAVGAVTGSIMTGVLVSELQQPTVALVIGGGTGVLLSTLLSALLYDASRPPREPDPPSVTATPLVAPVTDGLVLGLSGTFL